MSSKLVASIVALGLSACAAETGALPSQSQQQSETTTSQASTKPVVAATPNAPTKKACPAAPTGSAREDQVCWRWRCDGDPNAATAWNGKAATCDAGSVDEDSADLALRRINAHRFLADLTPFVREEAWDHAGQACALIADANAKLTHTPSKDETCWTKEGSDVSDESLLANRSLVPSIAAYFEDPGNETAMAHRRWLLDETLASVGFGSTDKYSCVVVEGRSVSKPAVKPTDVRGWAAWPPAGAVPMDVFEDENLDTAGWTLQSTGDDLEKASVEVARDGVDMPITVTHLTAGLGSRSAIRFVPQGWKTEAGHAYAVHVIGSAAIPDFTIRPIDCGL